MGELGLLDRVAAVGADDDEDGRFLKRLQLVMALSSIPVLGGVGIFLLALGLAEASIFPLAYVVATLLLIGLLARGRHALFRDGHLGLVLLAPSGLHWYLGGYAGSGGWVLWSTIPPVAALMFVGPRRSVWFFGAFVLVVLAAGLREGPLATDVRPLPEWARSFFFVFNTIGVSAFMFLGMRYFVERLEKEKRRSERLLLNVLPAPIAARLKREEGVIADAFDEVTVLFSDLVGFTRLSAKLPPTELVSLLDAVFTDFDALADRHGLEKIKTIGDAYMVVGGLPEPRPDHAVAVARMALDMVVAVERKSRELDSPLGMRVGVHTGEVVAGVIGRRKFSYDLWGDTVNTASRMESHGEAGRVQVSAATAAHLRAAGFELEERGTIAVKGKGEMETFWLLGAAAAGERR